MSNILVSICCITYNHEAYISDALKSFLAQKTNFKFEILIHDDASTDRTAEIIKEFENKYPEIIKPIFQEENQYSKGVKINWTFNFPRANGKFIALCEGDDYWIDENKLQIQATYMNNHPNCSLCTHAAMLVTKNKKKIGFIRHSKVDKYYSTEEVILGGGGLFATNSMFFPRKLVETFPSFCKGAPIGDYPLTIYLSLLGQVYYLSKCMSVYRYMSTGSWSENIEKDKEKRIEHNKKITKLLVDINEYTNYKYSNVIEKRILTSEFNSLVSSSSRNILKSEKYNQLRKEMSIIQRIKYYIKVYFPVIKRAREIYRGLGNYK